jgi:TonB family protein
MELSQKSDKYYATAITLAFHGLLLLLFILYKIVTPLPPFPEDGGGGLGVELNFGNSEDGMGSTNPELLASTGTPQQSSSADPSEILHNDDPENYVPDIDNPKPKKPRKEYVELKRKTDGPVITKTVEPEVERRALYPSKSQKGGNEGNTGKAGNQGKEDGDPYARVYEGKGGKGGAGGDGKGSGKGEGGGDGDGKGTGKGSGISYDLAGRNPMALPKPAYNSPKSGRVVVDISVDENGKVISAKAGGRGTTVQDASLFREAEAAARRSKFSPSKDGAEKQVGTITYLFIRN